MRKCVHTIEKRDLLNGGTRLRACRRLLWRKRETVVLDGRRWDVYGCGRGHVTRILVKP